MVKGGKKGQRFRVGKRGSVKGEKKGKGKGGIRGKG
jgi:hypothetical protein